MPSSAKNSVSVLSNGNSRVPSTSLLWFPKIPPEMMLVIVAQKSKKCGNGLTLSVQLTAQSVSLCELTARHPR